MVTETKTENILIEEMSETEKLNKRIDALEKVVERLHQRILELEYTEDDIEAPPKGAACMECDNCGVCDE